MSDDEDGVRAGLVRVDPLTAAGIMRRKDIVGPRWDHVAHTPVRLLDEPHAGHFLRSAMPAGRRPTALHVAT